MGLNRSLFMLIAGIFILYFSSCEIEVILELPDEEGDYLIVEANITDHSNYQEIRLYRTSSFYDTIKGVPFNGAIVTISDSRDNEYFFPAHPNKERRSGYYINYDLSRNLKLGEEYYLTIKENNNLYTAKSTLLPVPDIDSISFRRNFLDGAGISDDPLYDVFVHFRNLPGPNYYLVNVYINHWLVTFTPHQKAVISDEGTGDYASIYTRTFRKGDLNRGDTISLQLRSISRKKYDFYLDFFQQTELSGNIFAGAPPANIPTNMSEGALGFFQVSSVSSSTRIFDPK